MSDKPFGEIPSWEETDINPSFTEKATPVDPRTVGEFESDWEMHQEIKRQAADLKELDDTNWKKIIDNFPNQVPESAMTPEERDEHLGAHPMTKHELEHPKEK